MKRFASEKALEKHRETSETYSIAYTWTKVGKPVASKFMLFSPSHNWVKYVNHHKDLQTRKPKRPRAGYLSGNSQLLAGDIYKTVANLPFARLWR